MLVAIGDGVSVADERVGEAIALYLGTGSSAFPRSDAEAVRARFPDADEGLVAKVEALAAEIMAIEIDWNSRSLSQGGDEARRVMAERHPELSDDALTALRWMFTYNWR